jgi:hypothetical protein
MRVDENTGGQMFDKIILSSYNILKTHSYFTTFTHSFPPDTILLLLLLHIQLELYR